MGHVSNPPFHPTKIAAAWRAQTQPDNPAARGIRRSGGPVPSATPYRNDLKPFEFDEGAMHVSKYYELMDSTILRKVDVVAARTSIKSLP